MGATSTWGDLTPFGHVYIARSCGPISMDPIGKEMHVIEYRNIVTVVVW